jgi:hypothetical protein
MDPWDSSHAPDAQGRAPSRWASALAGALLAAGVPRDAVPRFDTALKAGKSMLVVHCGAQEIRRARELLASCGLSAFDHYHSEQDVAPAVVPCVAPSANPRRSP